MAPHKKKKAAAFHTAKSKKKTKNNTQRKQDNGGSEVSSLAEPLAQTQLGDEAQDGAASTETAPDVLDKPTLETLPLEIKHEIFSHLLPGEVIEMAEPSDIGAPLYTYTWHVGILRANRQLGREAHVFLYSNNTFMMLVHTWPSFERFTSLASVPRAIYGDISTFNKHPFRLIHEEYGCSIRGNLKLLVWHFPALMLAESGEVADAENLLQDARYEAMHGAGRDTKVFADLNTDCVRMGIFAMLPESAIPLSLETTALRTANPCRTVPSPDLSTPVEYQGWQNKKHALGPEIVKALENAADKGVESDLVRELVFTGL